MVFYNVVKLRTAYNQAKYWARLFSESFHLFSWMAVYSLSYVNVFFFAEPKLYGAHRRCFAGWKQEQNQKY